MLFYIVRMTEFDTTSDTKSVLTLYNGGRCIAWSGGIQDFRTKRNEIALLD